ncbi:MULTISPECIES: DUF1120 domain-containing protein [Pseudomonas]|jgi:type 1 fimbria pilin|uniref:DUF1120 domain-containing protein n=1 Tax=Pseudomonas TaxID=286 RepID=UPI001AE6D783|nr:MULTISPECIES: DUF1120 domain-containing protein [unclassified Pseudomonas]WQG58825.1 DUF1120 domain-containing protein [Pseudomonas sp. RTB3]MBP1127916.1 type 1 fimbria pilin [Pseudomonas sp. PvP025]MDQ0396854.1 type 1 fimbria pilin [Pseudomonas sp. PvP006]MEB0105980.1 DUF1120 domain-containing protein [Pseudomonas sp. MH9.3]WPX78783.1 DUF1120 domain-containing protein [Pseudomonas sp. MH9.3]
MKPLNTLFAALLLTTAGSAVAASSVDLTVRGLITPSACEPSLPNGGNVDIGKISAKDLKADSYTALPFQSLQLTVRCDAATLMALEPKDNRAGSEYENDTGLFGLGMTNDSEKLGGMELTLLNATADGVASRVITSFNNGTSWTPMHMFQKGALLSVTASDVNTPTPVSQMTADMIIRPVIAPANGLTLNNEVAIDGSVTLTVKYL